MPHAGGTGPSFLHDAAAPLVLRENRALRERADELQREANDYHRLFDESQARVRKLGAELTELNTRHEEVDRRWEVLCSNAQKRSGDAERDALAWHRKLAAAEAAIRARDQALQMAHDRIREDHGTIAHGGEKACGYCDVMLAAHAALSSTPADALRALLLRVAERAWMAGEGDSGGPPVADVLARLVDAVLAAPAKEGT